MSVMFFSVSEKVERNPRWTKRKEEVAQSRRGNYLLFTMLFAVSILVALVTDLWLWVPFVGFATGCVFFEAHLYIGTRILIDDIEAELDFSAGTSAELPGTIVSIVQVPPPAPKIGSGRLVTSP